MSHVHSEHTAQVQFQSRNSSPDFRVFTTIVQTYKSGTLCLQNLLLLFLTPLLLLEKGLTAVLLAAGFSNDD